MPPMGELTMDFEYKVVPRFSKASEVKQLGFSRFQKLQMLNKKFKCRIILSLSSSLPLPPMGEFTMDFEYQRKLWM